MNIKVKKEGENLLKKPKPNSKKQIAGLFRARKIEIKPTVEQAQLLSENSLTMVYQHLSDEIGANLHQVLDNAINGLKQKDLLTRFKESE